MNKKILIIGLLICIMIVVPTVIANNNLKINTCNKVVEEPGIVPSESSEIKYARIGGSCNSFEVKGKSFEIGWSYIVFGEVKIWAGSHATSIDIRGLDNLNNHIFVYNAQYVYATRFIGFFHLQVSEVYSVTGFAFGYIEWSEGCA